jgi:hypothetical protein
MASTLFRRAVTVGGLWLGLVVGAGVLAQQESAPTSLVAGERVPPLFAGHWDYNDEESMNAGTGRREQVPESATSRSAANNTPRERRGASGPTGGASGFDGNSGIYRALPTMTTSMIRDAENFVRDMLEIPEQLHIRVLADAVVFTDDLQRERKYPTDGREHEFRLSASKFDAKVVWEGPQLKRELSGGAGFRIYETYFLSDDRQRMFVIIRVKAPQRQGFIAGFNRVYDRVGLPADGAVR